MTRGVIRLGDPTDHGGRVQSVSATHCTVDGVPLARVGDVCTCPRRGHVRCTIVEGDPDFTIDGVPVAYDGHKTSCGAILRSTLTTFSLD